MKHSYTKHILAASLSLASAFAHAGAIHFTELFSDHALPPFDDTSSGTFPIFTSNFFGTTTQTLSVNSNGVVSIGNLWPINFNQLAQSSQNPAVLAPFFANVDNRYGGTIQWGMDMIDGHQVMGAQWLNVMAYNHHPDKTNSFQVIITDRSDVAAGAFDFEFNYDSITWDSADSGWWDANTSQYVARTGWNNNDSGESFEFAGSGIAGALLDSNLETGLIHNSRNTEVAGRYLFQVRDGQVLPEITLTPVPVPPSLSLLLGGLGVLGLARRRAD